MGWLFIIPIVSLAIPIAVLSISYDEKELTLLERLELYTIDIGVSLADTNNAGDTCDAKILDDYYILNAVKDIERSIEFKKELRDYYPDVTLWDGGISLSTSPSRAYSLLSMIDKNAINSNYKIKPYDEFACITEYNGNYYKIVFRVSEFYVLEDESYEVIRITEKDYNNIRIVTTYPNSLELWHPFNDNVRFVNELSDKIRVTVYYDGQVVDSFSLSPRSESMRDIRVSDIIMGLVNRAVLTYHILPYNMEGSIMINRYPNCMNEEQAERLFGLVGVKIVFPRYLPEGYEYECTVHVVNTIAYSYYSNEEIRSSEKRYYYPAYEGEALVIVNYKFLSYDERKDAREWYEYVKQYYDPNALLLTINNMEGVVYSYRGHQNIVSIYYDDHAYTIRGILSIDELIKIAQSLE